MLNLAQDPSSAKICDELDKALQKKLDEQKDEFLPGEAYIEKWGYTIDDTGTVPYTH